MNNNPYVSVILCAGGTGSRMNEKTPKQYLSLGGKPVACYSLAVFLEMPEVAEIIVVCESAYRHIFTQVADRIPIRFAEPGKKAPGFSISWLKNGGSKI